MSVFICHAKEDKERVRELTHFLDAQGFSTWLDEQQLLPGQEWELEIERAIRSAAAFVACLSKISVSKIGYVQKEQKFALNVALHMPPGSTFIIPCKLTPDVVIPEALQQWQALDLGQPDAMQRLCTALTRRYQFLRQNEVQEASPELSAELERNSAKVLSEVADAVGRPAFDAPTKTDAAKPTRTDRFNRGGEVIDEPAEACRQSDVKTLRSNLHLSQQEFAEAFGLPVATIRNWEQGRTKPSESTAIYLGLISAMPERVAKTVRQLQDSGRSYWLK